MPSDFWLYKWIDEFDVKSEKATSKTLVATNKRAIQRLEELAAADVWHPLDSYGGPQPAILAGRGIDLSGDLDCCHHVCQTRQVDALFGRVLHYFDVIVVAGPPAHRYVDALAGPHEQVLEKLRNHVVALLYLRKIGVEDMIVFEQKPPACSEHYVQHAAEAGLGSVIEQAAPWVERIIELGNLDSLDRHEDHWHFQFSHPELEHSVWGVVTVKDRAEPALSDVAEVVFARYTSHLVSDVAAARALGLPLGAAVQLHEDVLGRSDRAGTIDDVAFDLQLPVLAELPIRDVIRLRQDEMEYFLKFREALSAAIRERITNGDSTANAVEKVRLEVIEPALVDIAARLRTAERTLIKKVGTAVAFGALTTTVGVLGGAPLVVGAGVAAMGTSVPAAQKYLEDRGSIELSDMYFLWRLEVAAAGRHRH